MNKYAIAVRYGVIGALITCIISFLSYLFYRQLFGSFTMSMATRFIFFAIGLFIPIWGGITFRRANNGNISFLEAFTAVFIIYMITAFAAVMMSYLICNVIDPQYPDNLTELLKNTTRDTMEKFGAQDDQIEKTMEQFKVENIRPTMRSSVMQIGISAIIGAVLSIIVGLFIKRNSETPVIKRQQADPTN
jgi:hypothetical protein